MDADGILDFKCNKRASSPLVGKDRARTPRRQAFGDGSAMTRSDRRRNQIEEVQEKQNQLFVNETKTKAIVAQDAPRPTKEVPKLSHESSKEEVKAVMPSWSTLNKKQIVDNILKLFGDDKSATSLMAMTKANLVNYAQNKVRVKVDKTEKLVKTPTTMKPGKSRAQGRNKGVTA